TSEIFNLLILLPRLLGEKVPQADEGRGTARFPAGERGGGRARTPDRCGRDVRAPQRQGAADGRGGRGRSENFSKSPDPSPAFGTLSPLAAGRGATNSAVARWTSTTI